MTLKRSLFKYTSCYCEENIYKLLQQFKTNDLKILPANRTDYNKLKVLFLSNKYKAFPIWFQRAGSYNDKANPGFTIWDYHVILFDPIQKMIYDLDSTLKMTTEKKLKISVDKENPTFPTPAKIYFNAVFRDYLDFQEEYVQKIHVIDSSFYLNDFASDRSHMIDSKTGKFMAEPPDYECIVNEKNETNNLDCFRYFGEEDKTEKGVVYNVEEFKKEFGI